MERRIHSTIVNGCLRIFESGREINEHPFDTISDGREAQHLFENMLIHMGFEKDAEYMDSHHFIKK